MVHPLGDLTKQGGVRRGLRLSPETLPTLWVDGTYEVGVRGAVALPPEIPLLWPTAAKKKVLGGLRALWASLQTSRLAGDRISPVS
jgi:hypothetical protein